MHDIHPRMTGFHHLLTGGLRQPAWPCTYPPRHLWGDIGLAEGQAPAPRRSLPARLFRFW
ncbi:hypothetical protein PAA8504_03978 [Palleronia abyssalis]|uniref:Uncharacterized protein n=1 Tax=Palleronia abyssalis TaxID=1501240 RepID=A0A2R8C158_9RHOB|nr:hypothetical protein PAA8504_03978 [Palleronia abyssalis]